MKIDGVFFSTHHHSLSLSACRIWQNNTVTGIYIVRELDQIRKPRNTETLLWDCYHHNLKCVHQSLRKETEYISINRSTWEHSFIHALIIIIYKRHIIWNRAPFIKYFSVSLQYVMSIACMNIHDWVCTVLGIRVVSLFFKSICFKQNQIKLIW